MAEWFEQWFDDDYALLYAHRDEEEARSAVAMALKAAPELAHGPVLDLACGSGRHLAALHAHHPEAYGLDLSAALLSRAPASLAGHLVRGDMRSLPFRPQTFLGICLWFTPFGYFDDARNAALLGQLRDLLVPGGVLWMDYLNAHHLAADLVPEETIERCGIRIFSRRRFEAHRVIKEMVLTRLETGEERHAVESVRVYDPEQIEAMARQVGLGLRSAFGDYQGQPYALDSPRWIGVFQRDR